MRSFKKALAVAMTALGLGAGAVSSARADLALGDPAPALTSVTWLKGEPVKEWQKGQIYVLDFWATWCGPCIRSMPHIAKLQNQYGSKGVNVIGVAVWPKPGMKPTKTFVEAQGEKINYRIAEDIANRTAQAVLEPLGVGGIPTVLVVDQQGRLAWMGHPMDGLDKTIDEMLAGTYDVKSLAERKKKERETEAQAMKIIGELQAAQIRKDWDEAARQADRLLELDSENFFQAGVMKYMILLKEKKDKAAAADIGKALIAGPFAKNLDGLQMLASVITYTDEIDDADRDLDLALSAANAANTIENEKNADVVSTLAKIHALKKDYDKAIAFQNKAIELTALDQETQEALKEELDAYKKAAGKTE